MVGGGVRIWEFFGNVNRGGGVLLNYVFDILHFGFAQKNDHTSASDFDFALPPLSDRVVYLPQDGSTK